LSVNIDEHILKSLAAGGRLLTIGDLAREFGIDPRIVVSAAHRIVDDGLARASYVEVHGVSTLHGLAPFPAPAGRTE